MTSTRKYLPYRPSVHASFFRRFFGNEKSRELSETIAFFETVRRAFDASVYSERHAINAFMIQVVNEACERAGIVPSAAFGEILFQTVRGLLIEDGSLFGFREVDNFENLSLEEGVRLRAYLRRKERFLQNSAEYLDIWAEKTIRIFEGVISYLPPSAITDDTPTEDAEDYEGEDERDEPSPTVSLIDLCDKPAEVIERAIMTFFDDDVTKAGLFEPTRELLDSRTLLASGIMPADRASTRKAIVLPTAARNKSNAQLVESYLGGTAIETLFNSQLPFTIPFPARFEHTHIVGGSGHGKTQLMQLSIYRDLMQSREDGRSIVVIDSQGDLIRVVSHLACFGPDAYRSLVDRLVIIDPNDVEYPVCLNMFDFNRGRMESYSPLDREKVLNSTIELFEYMFGALLGAELTQKQGVIFKYLARLMLEIPDATVHTFRELMENGEKFRPYMERLQGTTRSFFETRFFDRTFNETKKQILTRLWGVLSNATFERMFSNTTNKVDMFDAMNDGKIILINTAKELLKQEGCAIFGRFFIAQISQAAIQRAALPPHERRPTFVYIDETQDYFDQNIEQLLNQARKYRVGMVLAHQNLDQLSTGLRASIMASTSIKFAGGVSAKDARTFAADMRCEPEFVQERRKRPKHTEFACWVKNLTPQAIGVTVPLGYVEDQPTITKDDYQILIEGNRDRYCAPIEFTKFGPPSSFAPDVVVDRVTALTPPTSDIGANETTAVEIDAPPPPASEPSPILLSRPVDPSKPKTQKPSDIPPPPLGRGGRQHQYLQHLLKQAAEERGYRAVIEEPILEGTGRVDVSLSRRHVRIACEISVNTKGDQELGNIEKCIAAGYGQVILVAQDQRHLSTMRKFILGHLEGDEAEKVQFMLPDEFMTYLDGVTAGSEANEEMIHGYKVKVTHRMVSEKDAEARRKAITQVLARSLGRLKES